jgi:hypothetical protein
MDAGKQRLSRDTTRHATRQEINALKTESEDLKGSVARSRIIHLVVFKIAIKKISDVLEHLPDTLS